MNPEQQNGQYPGMPAQNPQPGQSGHDPYGFIMNPQPPAKRPTKLLPSGDSPLQRLAIFGGGLVVLIIIFAIVMSFIGKSGQVGMDDVITVAQEQSELLRIATAAGEDTSSLATQNLASNLALSMQSAQNQTVAYLKENGHKVGTKTLALKRSTATDTTLQNAKEAGTYDSTFRGIVQTELTDYESSLTKAYRAKPGPKGEAMLQAQFNAAKLLETQSKQQ